MPKFGSSSQRRLDTLHPDLQKVLNEAIKIMDFSVVCGHRGKDEQNAAYAAGNSGVQYPNSKHNTLPSFAVDVVPWPTQYADERYVMLLSGVIMGVAAQMGVKLRWGGNWDGDSTIMDDQNLKDPYHFELA